jgi:GAF domain-containing protein
MEPIPESLEALRLLSETHESDLIEQVRRTAETVRAHIPDCVAISVTILESGLTFTLASTSERLRRLDGAQYLDGGPCQAAAEGESEIEVADILDEDRWQLFAQASAAEGVRSSLSLPLRGANGTVYGSLNLYGSIADTFAGHSRELAAIFGAAAAEAISNSDLSMASLGRAQQAPAAIRDADTVSVAVGILAGRESVPVDEARQRLLQAAARAGTSPVDLADLIISRHHDNTEVDDSLGGL